MPAVYMEYHNKAWQTGTSVLSLDWKSKVQNGNASETIRDRQGDRDTDDGEPAGKCGGGGQMRKRKCSNPSWQQHQEGGTRETGEISGAEWSARGGPRGHWSTWSCDPKAGVIGFNRPQKQHLRWLTRAALASAKILLRILRNSLW